MATIKALREIPDLYVSLAADVPDEVVSDLVEEAKGSAFYTVRERREPEFFAAVEWLIPTAVLLFLGRKFIDTFAEEAAKDAYPAVKAALSAQNNSTKTMVVRPSDVALRPVIYRSSSWSVTTVPS